MDVLQRKMSLAQVVTDVGNVLNGNRPSNVMATLQTANTNIQCASGLILSPPRRPSVILKFILSLIHI